MSLWRTFTQIAALSRNHLGGGAALRGTLALVMPVAESGEIVVIETISYVVALEAPRVLLAAAPAVRADVRATPAVALESGATALRPIGRERLLAGASLPGHYWAVALAMIALIASGS